MKKITTFLFIISTFFANLNALPGFKQPIPDASGDFVYYKDNTFRRESYIGFICYDESTFCARYYAPEDKEQELSEKSVEVYFTIDPKADHMELTGEKILGSYTQDDGEYINYIHDMIYELNARRIKAEELSFDSFHEECNRNSLPESFMERFGYKVVDDFMQFGGQVTEIFDPIIPLFNLKKIIDQKGNTVFYAVALGYISNSTDKTFQEFKGIPENSDNSKQSETVSEKTEKKQFSFKNQRITLDKNWTNTLENLKEQNFNLSTLSEKEKEYYSKLWFLGKDALLSFDESKAVSESPNFLGIPGFLLRRYFSTPGAFTSLSSLKVSFQKDSASINYVSINPKATGNTTSTIKINRNSDSVCFLSLNAHESFYNLNQKYLQQIIDSYTIQKK